MHPAQGSQESMRISEGAIICRSLPQQNIKASPELLEAIVSISIRPAINAKKKGNALSDSLWSSGEGVALGVGTGPQGRAAALSTMPWLELGA